MATQQEVRQYLAYWFQLGKKVIMGNNATSLLPQSVLKGDRFSQEFEDCWQTILSRLGDDCYLEGTHETIAQLLTPEWEMLSCCRCSMPVPVRSVGMPAVSCPCDNLPNWPNTELPPPRCPISTEDQLMIIRTRLLDNISVANS